MAITSTPAGRRRSRRPLAHGPTAVPAAPSARPADPHASAEPSTAPQPVTTPAAGAPPRRGRLLRAEIAARLAVPREGGAGGALAGILAHVARRLSTRGPTG